MRVTLREMQTRCRKVLPPIVVLCSGLVSEPARADDVLVFQTQNNDPQGADAAAGVVAATLTTLGHTVTTVAAVGAALPSDLSPYDTVWIPQITPLSGPQQTTLRAFVEGGGGLYLTGERPCCESANAAVQNLLGLLLPTTPLVGNLGEGGDLFTANAADPFQITSLPNALVEWKTLQAGLMNVPAQHRVFLNAGGGVGAAAWTPEYLEQGAGCVYVAMDISFLLPNFMIMQDLEALTENIQHFLVTCNDSDSDGVSDETEIALGTLPNDADTDNDGLCDGYADVLGTCVGGESVFANSDGDGLIDPLDEDDDGDGISTAFELAAENLAPNVDDDDLPAWLDPDSDNNFIPDSIEGESDFNNNGIPAIVEDGDDPQDCNEDSDCGAADSGMVCDLAIEYCIEGCHTPGNGCPSGLECTSSDESIGECVPEGAGGGGPGGGGPGGGGPGGGGPGGGGPGGGGPGGGQPSTGGGASGGGSDGGASADGGAADDGCDCAVPAADPTWEAQGLWALLLLALRRKRKPS